MTRDVSLTAIYESVEGDWVQARVKEIPEVITAAPSKAEAKELLLDALWEYLQALGGASREDLEGASMSQEELAISIRA
jgi:predicted RNase H-like HicB family nuclease